MKTLHSWKWVIVLLLNAIAAPAQTLTTLVNFNLTDGAFPVLTSLTQGKNGAFYGTTESGGANDEGTIFKITSDGTLTTLYAFCSQISCADGAAPYAGLVLATDGNFYGTTSNGGHYNGNQGYGTIFRFTPGGVLTTLHSFENTDGSIPVTSLTQASDGNFYGTTEAGGDLSCNPNPPRGCGTIFKITPGGTFTTLHTFELIDGAIPSGPILQAIDGNLYGVAGYGGAHKGGTLYRVGRGGGVSTFYDFCSQPNCSDGMGPDGPLVQIAGNIYGTTYSGGANNNGTVFGIDPSGKLTTLHLFNGTEGALPDGGLILGTDGNLYGTASSGGLSGGNCGPCGTIFDVTLDGVLTVLHSFDGREGYNPQGSLLQATSGTFYGFTAQGGTYGYGTVFNLSVALGPFVAFVRPYGKVGQTGGILGQGFTGTTSVSLNGTPASFTVVSDTFIKTTVPPGATTGFVQVVTPSGTLTSNVPFRVIP